MTEKSWGGRRTGSGRPSRQQSYERITVDVRSDILEILASFPETRREYIEQALEEKLRDRLVPTNPLTPEFVRYREDRAVIGFFLYWQKQYPETRSRYYARDDQGLSEIFVGKGIIPPEIIEDHEVIYCKEFLHSNEDQVGFIALKSAVPEYTK